MILQCLRRWSRRHLSFRRLWNQLLILWLVLTLTYSGLTWIYSSSTQTPKAEVPRPLSPLISKQAKFWRELYTLFLHNDPKCEYPPEVVVPHKFDVRFDAQHDHPRPDILFMPSADLKRMTVAHATFLNDLRKNTPTLVYVPGTKGMVMTASLNQLPVLIIGLRMLRLSDCQLPVEVFLPSLADYGQQVCNLILPTLNARCVVLSDIVTASKTGVVLDGYQHKVTALLFSSFEDILLLDSDTFPTRDPSHLFDNEPFTTSGMILWPDFWYPSESTYFFEITQLGAPPPTNSRPAIESGQIMFSKRKHGMSLMLAAYYNYYGPLYYYRLLSQGAPGEGDKDTFAWAATIMNSNVSFYVVQEPVVALGHDDSNGVYVGSAMAQHDPTRDAEGKFGFSDQDTKPNTAEDSADVNKSNKYPNLNLSSPSLDQYANSKSKTRPLFIHANFPTFDPSTIFTHGENGTARPLFDSNSTTVRAWLSEEHSITYFGYDIERIFWAEIEYVACTWEDVFAAWKGEKDICYNVKMYREQVFGAE